MTSTAEAASQRARAAQRTSEVKALLTTLRRLTWAAYQREPEVWSWELDGLAGRVSEMRDAGEAQRLIDQGRGTTDRAELEGVVRKLWRLLPPEAEERRRSFDSGVE